jgi:hypothetical protein
VRRFCGEVKREGWVKLGMSGKCAGWGWFLRSWAMRWSKCGAGRVCWVGSDVGGLARLPPNRRIQGRLSLLVYVIRTFHQSTHRHLPVLETHELCDAHNNYREKRVLFRILFSRKRKLGHGTRRHQKYGNCAELPDASCPLLLENRHQLSHYLLRSLRPGAPRTAQFLPQCLFPSHLSQSERDIRPRSINRMLPIKLRKRRHWYQVPTNSVADPNPDPNPSFFSRNRIRIRNFCS